MRLEYSSARKSAAPGCYHRIWCLTWSAVIEPHQQVCSPPSRGAAKIKLHAIHDSASELPHRCFGSQIVPRWRDATRKPTSRHGIFRRESAVVRERTSTDCLGMSEKCQIRREQPGRKRPDVSSEGFSRLGRPTRYLINRRGTNNGISRRDRLVFPRQRTGARRIPPYRRRIERRLQPLEKWQ